MEKETFADELRNLARDHAEALVQDMQTLLADGCEIPVVVDEKKYVVRVERTP